MDQLELNFRERYRYWEILDEIPDSWVIDKTAGSPAPRTVFITNGKSVLSGQQKRALLRVHPKPTCVDVNIEHPIILKKDK